MLSFLLFYLLYSQSATIFPQVVGKSHSVDSQSSDTDFPALLFAVPWGHHRYIIDKCKGDVNKALFYVHQTIENGWSRAILLNWMDTDLYERQGKAITNFSATLPDVTGDLVQEITKDPYDFAFAGITGKYNTKTPDRIVGSFCMSLFFHLFAAGFHPLLRFPIKFVLSRIYFVHF